jgi:adenosine deaminase
MGSTFADALEGGDLAGLRSFPKADLHNHGILCGDRDFLRDATGVDVAPLQAPIGSMAEMGAWVDANIGPLLYRKGGRTLLYEAAFRLALRDGVTRIRMGDDIGILRDPRDSALRVLNSLQAIHQRVAPAVEWIPLLGMSRHCDPCDLQRWLEPFLELGGFAVIDLWADEFAQPIEAFRPLYAMAKMAGLRLMAHVGEWGTAEDVRHAVDVLELDEVQHGIAAADSPEVMRDLAERGVRLNVCPTSNILLGRVGRLEDHPIRRLFDAGVKVTINTDDALVFGRSVSEEFLALRRCGLFTSSELDAIRINGLSDLGAWTRADAGPRATLR